MQHHLPHAPLLLINRPTTANGMRARQASYGTCLCPRLNSSLRPRLPTDPQTYVEHALLEQHAQRLAVHAERPRLQARTGATCDMRIELLPMPRVGITA